ncbi:DUF1801 domain-containing protein [Microbacterium sp. M3]|uniref:DUF1801 domain-containing protein n=1 Tax=Microbacterium arthrosphaerae TaxID=792652 RepID=A0ABU4H7Z5_9MICO|nr:MULTISPECIES: DUF1801 domain-containing protein [Microbacterium]MDW4574009.1 DUF1801 domain-containing protein [Microbacterium arthrosphaerae]MDW7607864.1 DUF1801 domain-containing protein [Microbacterium sp. M3]
MKRTGGDVDEFIAAVTPAKRQRDAATMVALMREVTGREPELWGTIVGFGSCHYRYPTGTEGDAPIAAFSPRRQATTVYLLDTGAHADELANLGPHDTGAGCLYIKDLDAVDVEVLRGVVAADYDRVVSGDTGSASFTVTG